MQGANPLYKPTVGNIVPPKDSLCTEIQRNQKTGHCETCQQCDYEIQYADSSSSLGVLAKDEIHLRMANGSLTNMNVVFGYFSLQTPKFSIFSFLISYTANSRNSFCL